MVCYSNNILVENRIDLHVEQIDGEMDVKKRGKLCKLPSDGKVATFELIDLARRSADPERVSIGPTKFLPL